MASCARYGLVVSAVAVGSTANAMALALLDTLVSVVGMFIGSLGMAN